MDDGFGYHKSGKRSGTRVTVPSEYGDNCVEPKNCEGEQPKEKRPCPETTTTNCYWSDWSEFSSCSRNCDTGYQTRTRQCICDGSSNDTKGDSVDSSYSESSGDSTGDLSSSPCACNGSTFETVPCNDFPCCNWGNFTEWSPCNQTCGGFSRRFAVCTCMPRYPTTPSDDCNSDSTDQSGNFDDDCTQSKSSDGSNTFPTDCGENNQDDCSDSESTSGDSTDCNGGNGGNKYPSSPLKIVKVVNLQKINHSHLILKISLNVSVLNPMKKKNVIIRPVNSKNANGICGLNGLNVINFATVLNFVDNYASVEMI